MWINSFCNQFFFCLYEEPEEAKTIYLLQIHTHTKIKKLEVNLICNNEEKLRVGRETYPWGKKRYLKNKKFNLKRHISPKWIPWQCVARHKIPRVPRPPPPRGHHRLIFEHKLIYERKPRVDLKGPKSTEVFFCILALVHTTVTVM